MFTETPKIALLFLTRSDLIFSDFWEHEIKSNLPLFNIYIHAKSPLQSLFFQSYQIAETIKTTWSKHVLAWQLLIKQALKEEANQSFIFLSESCLPLYPLKQIYDFLLFKPQTFLRYGPAWWESDDPRNVLEIPFEHRWGNSEWMILNRKQAELIANDTHLINLISRYPHDQESYFASLFSLLNCLNEVVNHTSTYSSWDVPKGELTPYTFTSGNESERQRLALARERGCLFARKFSPTFPIENYIKIYLTENLLEKRSFPSYRYEDKEGLPCSSQF